MIVDVEATRAICQAEVGAARTMIERDDGTFSRSDFTYDHEQDIYRCPAGKDLRTRWRRFKDQPANVSKEGMIKYRARKADCLVCPLKSRCCPRTRTRTILRSIHEGARGLARAIAKSDAGEASKRDRKKVEMLFAHLKRILRLGRLRLRGPCGASDEFLLAAIAQYLRKLAKLRPKLEPITNSKPSSSKQLAPNTKSGINPINSHIIPRYRHLQTQIKPPSSSKSAQAASTAVGAARPDLPRKAARMVIVWLSG